MCEKLFLSHQYCQQYFVYLSQKNKKRENAMVCHTRFYSFFIYDTS